MVATISNAAALFLMFRLAFHQLGPSVVGVWALLQGIMLISRLPDMGSAGNTTRLVAIEVARSGTIRLRNYLAASVIVNTVPILVIGLLICVPTYYYTKTSAQQAGVSLSILVTLIWQSAAFGVLSSLSSILCGCLDGLGLMALRGYLSSLANVLFIALGYVLIFGLGATGLGYAYIVLAILLILLCGTAILVFHDAPVDRSAEKSVVELVRMSFGFNANFLIIGICRLLLDPICKIMIGAFSTLELVAIFDLANKVTTQARILYSSPLQALLPLVSREGIDIEPGLHARLTEWNSLVARWSLYTMGLAVLSAGALSAFSFGHISVPFILMLLILSVANAITTMGLVGYYMDVGSGHLRRLIWVHVIMAILNVALGVLLGRLLGAIGVAFSFAIALTYAGFACMRPLFKSRRDIWRFLVRDTGLELLLFCAAAVVSWTVFVELSGDSMLLRQSYAGLAMLGLGALFFYRESGHALAIFRRRAPEDIEAAAMAAQQPSVAE